MGMIPGMPFKVKVHGQIPVHIPAQPPSAYWMGDWQVVAGKTTCKRQTVKQRPWIVVQVYGTVTKEL